MKKFRFFLFLTLIAPILINTALADGFMTSRDLLRGELSSNINLRNASNNDVTVFGLYVRQYSYVTPGLSCNQSTVIYSTTQNKTAGAVVMPVPVGKNKSVALGSNFLYNMIFNAIYFENIIIPSNPPGCALPGCTWGADTTAYNWCIYLGAMSPVSTSTGYTASVAPSTTDASSPGQYDYNLVSNYITLGPISCNDDTMSCSVANQQTQSF